MTVEEVLKWLAGAGSVAVASWASSWLLEGFVWWAKLATNVKQLLILLLSLVIGMLATWMMLLPPEQLQPYIPYLATGITAILAWLGLNVAHRLDGNRGVVEEKLAEGEFYKALDK
jgi:hypothetical protein